MAKGTAVTRYGTRYGRTIRERLAAAEAGHKGRQKCPYCAYQDVKRSAAGIWACGKCGQKFASRAYALRKVPAVTTKVEEGQDV